MIEEKKLLALFYRVGLQETRKMMFFYEVFENFKSIFTCMYHILLVHDERVWITVDQEHLL
ncbi:hypothetical protein A6F49_12735 [Enteractinococcus helveticum]|uniref:Uncharacterized protein n=1 Tax=Enteractinococcus helveticum TaxID=1837282 RepID=A0A1B7LY77_9MICC|nr:hypothetical protein A6F49_12735 [Enteractinococcus helveticum]